MNSDKAAARARRQAFIAALEKGLSVTGAAAAAGINRTLAYKWREALPAFAVAWDAAVQTAADLLEDEALRRAMEGVEKPVFYRGQQIGAVRTYNDRLLALLLQRRRPAAPAPRPPSKAELAAEARRREENAARAEELKKVLARAAAWEAKKAAKAAAEAATPPLATADDPGGPEPPRDEALPVAADGPPPAAKPAPRRLPGMPADIYEIPISQLSRMRDLTSFEAMEALNYGPEGYSFPPPWGKPR
jgi:hypothetical protein